MISERQYKEQYMQKFPKIMAKARKEKKMTHAELAKKVNNTEAGIKAIEKIDPNSDACGVASLSLACVILKVLGEKPEDVFKS